MKVKHFIITCGVLTCGILLGGLVATKGADAALKYEKSSDVQFTFEPMLNLEISQTGATSCGLSSTPAYCVYNLIPGSVGTSNQVNVKVISNSVAGWMLNASVGGTSVEAPSTLSYTNTDLALLDGTGTTVDGKFQMIATGTTSLSAGKWGYTIDGGTTYMDLPYYTTTPTKTINQTVDSSGSPAAGYIGDTTGNGMNTQIGAYARTTQISGAYGNVINYLATANVPSHQVTVVAGTGVASVSLNGSTSVLTGTFIEGDNTLALVATCSSGKTFAGWNVSPEFGSFVNRDNASTTFTVGANDVTITAYCGAPTT